MSNLAKKFQVEQTVVQPTRQPEKRTKGLTKKARLSLGEKLLWSFLGIAIFMGAVTIISTQVNVHSMQMENLQLQEEINTLTQITNELELEVGSLSTYERIAEVARKNGLTINEDNIRSLVD